MDLDEGCHVLSRNGGRGTLSVSSLESVASYRIYADVRRTDDVVAFKGSWLHASDIKVTRGARSGTSSDGGSHFGGFEDDDAKEVVDASETVGAGIEKAGSVTWDKAELKMLL